MDAHVKEGQLYIQHHKLLKKWKRSWAVLYADTQSGVARLEVFDWSGGEKPVGRRSDRKVIRLSECVTIVPAPEEACPHDSMAAFCVQTTDRTHILATDGLDSAEWVEKMCELAFQGGRGSGSCGQKPQMEENLIYESREEVREFWVTVQRTEASERCSLQGSYWLSVDSDALVLKELDTKRSLLTWPFKLLRRYGRDKGAFSVEAGRRCESGPGSFTFETQQSSQIFSLVEAAIREQKALVEEESPRSGLSLDPNTPEGEGTSPRSCSPLQPPVPTSANPLGDQSDIYSEPLDCVRDASEHTEAVYADPLDCVRNTPEHTEVVYANPLDCVRNTPEHTEVVYANPLDCVRNTPEHTEVVYADPLDCVRNASEHSKVVYADPLDCVRNTPEHTEVVYADPLDCVRNTPEHTEAVYADPLDCAEAPTPCPHHHDNTPEPLYSEVYDGAGSVTGQRAGIIRSERSRGEPGFNKPERQGAVRWSPKVQRAQRPANMGKSQRGSPPQPASQAGTSQGAPEALYSQVFKPAKRTHQKSTLDPDHDDIIYDNLGVI